MTSISSRSFIEKPKSSKSRKYFLKQTIRFQHEQAQSIVREIGALGTFENGQSYLDKFRFLIQYVGNSLGFIRLLRSAALNQCSKKIECLNPLENFDFTSDIQDFSDTTQQLAENLEAVIKKL